MRTIRCFVLLVATCVSLPLIGVERDVTEDDRAGETYRRRVNEKLDSDIEKLTAQIAETPKNVDLYSRRGDARFFRGKFAESVADFDKMVELRADLDSSHWRRGIARFYAEKYEQAAHQFETYHSFDNIDRENGIWRYLSQFKANGKTKAREGLLRYEKDDREPFPDVYRLFAGDLTGKEVLERINRAEITKDEREKRLFYAELYVGLNDFVEGDSSSAEKHLEAAVLNRWGETAGGGPTWMWHVARVHHDLLHLANEAPAGLSREVQWNVTLTLRDGNGGEMIQNGWYKITLQADRKLAVTVFRNADGSLENGKTVYDQKISDEQYGAIVKATGEAVGGALVARSMGRGADGLEVSIAAVSTDARREIRWTGRDLLGADDASTGLGKLIKRVNDVVDPKAATIRVR